MKYKIHTAYINNNGSIVKAGVYDESEIDLAEARNKTIITLTDVDLETTIRDREDLIINKKVNNASYEEGKYFKEITLEPKVELVQVKHIDVNNDSEDNISKIKYVGKALAKKAIAERKLSPFINYVDMDTRVPLSFNRKWQDISALVFNKIETITPEQEFIKLI